MAREKKKRAPKAVCYRFHRETETDYAKNFVCAVAHIMITWTRRWPFERKKSLKVFALIFGAFFLVIIPRNKAVVRTNQGVGNCAAGGI